MEKKKWNALAAALAAAVLLAGCGGTGTEESIRPPAGLQDGGTGGAEETSAVAETTASRTVTLTAAQIYQADGLTVTAAALEDGVFGPFVEIQVANDTGRNVVITTQHLSVNGYMMDTSGLYSSVAAGKKANDELNLMESELEQAGIGTIGEIAFQLHIADADSYETIADSEPIVLETSAAGTFTQPVDDSGHEVYNQDGIRVVCKGLKQDVVWDGTVVFYMENLSSRPVTVYAENVSVNGYMVDVSLWSDLQPETRSIDGMYLMDLEELDLPDIEGVENVELSLRIVDGENWSEIDSTDPIMLEF